MRFSWTFVAAACCACLAACPAAAHQVELEAACGVPDAPGAVFVPISAHTIDCTLDTTTDSDAFVFTGTAGTRVRVMLASEADHLDPRLIVSDRAPNVIADVTCDGGSVALPSPRCAATFEFVVPAGGLYDIEVREAGEDETGNYVLQVEELPGAVDDVINQDVFSDFEQLIVATDIDHYKVNAAVGQAIEIELESCDDYLDPRIEIWDPNGEMVAEASCTTPPGPPPPLVGPTDCASEVPGSQTLCSVVTEFDVAVTGIQRISLSDAGSNGRGRYRYFVRRMPEASSGLAAISSLTALSLLAARARRR